MDVSQLLNQILAVSPVVTKILTTGAGGLAIIAGTLNMLLLRPYTVMAVSLWSAACGSVALACETSLEGHLMIMKLFPFLESYLTRGVAYVAMGILTLGEEFGFLARTAGSLFLLSGIIHILLSNLPTSGGLTRGANTSGIPSSASSRVTFQPISPGYKSLSATGSEEETERLNPLPQKHDGLP